MNKQLLINKKILLIFVLLFLSSCKSQNSKRYINNKDSFSIEFPANWEVKENYFRTTVMALSPLENSSDNFRENVNVVVETIPPGTSLNEYFSSSIKNMRQLNKFNDEFSGIEKFGKAETKWLYYTHEMDAYKFKVILYQLVKGNKGYSITCTAKAEDFDKFKNQFKNIASTFKME